MASTGFVQITVLEAPALREMHDQGVRFECLAIPQLGHRLVVATVTEGHVSFYDVGMVVSLIAPNFYDFEVVTYNTEDDDGTFEINVRLHPSLKLPYQQ